MLDLETYGTAAGCPVLSIGAIVFVHIAADPLGYYTFYGEAHKNQSDIGLYPDPATVAWWEQQNDEAKKVLTVPHTFTITNLLKGFAEWLPADAKVWGNGADFDLPILGAAYKAAGMPIPWSPWNGRCYRTIKNLAPDIKLVRKGTYHNAMDDAASQADHLMVIAAKLGLVFG